MTDDSHDRDPLLDYLSGLENRLSAASHDGVVWEEVAGNKLGAAEDIPLYPA